MTMQKKAPPVRDHMTHLPVEAERCETVGDAARLMATHSCRHLPVMSGSRLKGIVSERDILSARLQFGEQADQKQLEQVCQPDVLTVSPLAAIDQVVKQMLARRVGSAVVVDGGFVVGVFTASDALRMLCKLFDKA